MNEETKLGGRGKCKHCGKWENNVSYHEAWECPKRPIDNKDKKVKMPTIGEEIFGEYL